MTPPNERSRTAQRVGKLSPAAARWLGEAATALSRGQLDVTEQHLTAVLAVAPTCAEALRLMGVAAQMRGHHAAAVDYLRDALASCPDDATVHMNLGTALYETGAIDAALSSFRDACALAPELAAGWYNLGKALKLQHALAIDPAHELRAHHPGRRTQRPGRRRRSDTLLPRGPASDTGPHAQQIGVRLADRVENGALALLIEDLPFGILQIPK